MHYLLDGTNVVNVLHFFISGGYSQSDIDALASVVDAWVGAYVLPIQSTALEYVNTSVKGLQSIIDLIGNNNAHAGNGALTGARVPNESTLAISFRTALSGRSARGRMYVPTVSASQLAGTNEVNSTFITDWTLALSALRVAALDDGWVHSVLSRVTAGVLRSEAVPFTITNYIAVDNILDSQRGRKPTG